MVTRTTDFSSPSQRQPGVAEVFTPWAPIDSLSLFRGRSIQMQMLVDAVTQSGRHAIIFGDRGVGKSSIANVLQEAVSWSVQLKLMFVHVNCDFDDTFDSLWRKIFQELSVTEGNRVTNLENKSLLVPRTLEQWLGTTVSPEDIRRLSSLVDSRLIIIIDEFDQLIGNVEAAHLMANTIKTLSDRRTPVTLVLVGVADSITQLIAEHESVERNLVQLHIPGMSDIEIGQIVRGGLARLEMTVSADNLNLICLMARGLPAVAQLLGFHLARTAMKNGRSQGTLQDLENAIAAALEAMPESNRQNWEQAVGDVKFDSITAKVLMSAALAPVDQFGWFDMRDAMELFRTLTGVPQIGVDGYLQQLHTFATNRGTVLDRKKLGGWWRFRFRNSSFQSYVIMTGISSGLITRGVLSVLKPIDAGNLDLAGYLPLAPSEDKNFFGEGQSKGNFPQPELLESTTTQLDAGTITNDSAQNSSQDSQDYESEVSGFSTTHEDGKSPPDIHSGVVSSPCSSAARRTESLSTTEKQFMNMRQKYNPLVAVRLLLLRIGNSMRAGLLLLFYKSSLAFRVGGALATGTVIGVIEFLRNERVLRLRSIAVTGVRKAKTSLVKPLFKDALIVKGFTSPHDWYKTPTD